MRTIRPASDQELKNVTISYTRDTAKSRNAFIQRRARLEREIAESSASQHEKDNMQYTLSKMATFASEAIDEASRADRT
jgi:hypothetical protein